MGKEKLYHGSILYKDNTTLFYDDKINFGIDLEGCDDEFFAAVWKREHHTESELRKMVESE